ncbi:MAG TPA: hypothetical protein VF078_03115, partial [Nitrospira sp.]
DFIPIHFISVRFVALANTVLTPVHPGMMTGAPTGFGNGTHIGFALSGQKELTLIEVATDTGVACFQEKDVVYTTSMRRLYTGDRHYCYSEDEDGID